MAKVTEVKRTKEEGGRKEKALKEEGEETERVCMDSIQVWNLDIVIAVSVAGILLL